MDVCNAKNRIGYYAPTCSSGSSGGTGTWTIASTETSNVAQSIMYINAVDIQANHGSFTTLTLNGTDVSTTIIGNDSKTKFMSTSSSPDTTTFSSAITAPSITLTGGVLTLTTLNATTGVLTNITSTGTGTIANITSSGTITSSATGKISALGGLEIAKPPLFTYTAAPSLSSTNLGYFLTTWTANQVTLSASYQAFMPTSAVNVPLGVWRVDFSIRVQYTANSVNNTAYLRLTLGGVEQYVFYNTIPAVSSGATVQDIWTGSFVFTQSNSTAQAIEFGARTASAITSAATFSSTSSTKVSFFTLTRIA